MDRTLDDIEGRCVIVPPGEGVSLAEIDKLESKPAPLALRGPPSLEIASP